MWQIVAGLSSLIAATGLVAGWPLVSWIAGLTVVITLVFMVARAAFVQVPELSLAIIYNRERQAFSRLLPGGRHWLLPFAEEVQAVVSLGAETAAGTCQAYTNGGVPLAVHWRATYRLELLTLPRETQARLALKLARKSRLIAQSHVSNCLQLVMSHYSIDAIFAAGGRGRLEREVRQAAAERLAPSGMVIQRVTLESLEMPAQVQSTLAAAHERRVQVESDARALAYLQKIVSQFSDRDMQQLAELERMRVLGQHGVSLVYPLTAMMPALPAVAAQSSLQPVPLFPGEPARREFTISH